LASIGCRQGSETEREREEEGIGYQGVSGGSEKEDNSEISPIHPSLTSTGGSQWDSGAYLISSMRVHDGRTRFLVVAKEK
jgi:hypothetical protein